MANSTISMSKIRQILRMYSQGRSKLSIAEQTGVSRNTAKKYMATYDASGLTFEQINSLNDKELDDFFGTVKEPPSQDRLLTLQRCFPHIDKELKRTGVNRRMLWEAYKKEFPDGFAYTQFCFHLTQWKARVNPVMHQDHKAGDKLYVDFAGVKLSLTDKETGEVTDVEVFVAILGASQLTYVEAVMSQQKEDFIAACENTLHYIGGVPAAIVPDNLKAAVTKSHRYEPTLNEAFADFADHYGTTILPARAYRPRDKALVEGAVKIVYSRIYAPLRKQVYSSLTELNSAILQALEVHNSQLLRGRNYSRRLQFEEIERSALAPLPLLRYEFKKHAHVTVMKNGHVCLGADKHYYSVPYRFIGKKIKLLYSTSLVEMYYHYERIALHKRVKSPYSYSTDKEHLASTHRFVTDWTPERFLEWAASIHDDVRLYILKILDRKQHPEQAYRSCIGILSFAKKAGEQRLISACQRALSYGIYNYKTIQTILEKNMDQYEDSLFADELQMPKHDNIRGEDYYQ
ncbi:IS21 family transposase [Dyadobacter psychrotolerans]|uniref:IS21 family transposase n=1 Tax=Dyadobacter psychrotolerans TaxID=2541721 RepID=A0A4R5DVF8_9BACT|nr:IS21 family transposase [Dyadobacter psychrotolerans]TDE18536.1 IS21 family transposase [Dyadobacter psychrotolerans]